MRQREIICEKIETYITIAGDALQHNKGKTASDSFAFKPSKKPQMATKIRKANEKKQQSGRSLFGRTMARENVYINLECENVVFFDAMI